MTQVFDRDWSLALNLGIKCNGAPILDRLKYRYISSPFDNMDSVEGLTQAGRLIASRFEGYWDDKNKWCLRNDRAARETTIRAKIAWHEDYPGLYFPHFYAGWLDGVSAETVQEWIADPNGALEFVWEGLSTSFKTRQQRIVELLESEQPILFVRIDERRQMRRLQTRTFANDTQRFVTLVQDAYPKANIGFVYYYCPREGERTPENTDKIAFVPIPDDASEPAFVSSHLKENLTLQPRKNLVLETA